LESCYAKPVEPVPTAHNNLKVRVNAKSDSIFVTNLDHFAWKHTRFFINSMGKPENFRSSMMTVAPRQTVRISYQSFHRSPQIGSPDFNPNGGNTVEDFLIVCDTPKGHHQGYWFGDTLALEQTHH
jgi:hypothetical protein